MLKYGFGTPKRHILAQNRVLWRILRRCPWWRLGCRWFPEPPKKIAESPMVREVAHARKRNPLSDVNKILRGGRYPRHNHLCQFWWRSVKGLRGCGGSKFAILHWLWSSPLQHSVMQQLADVSFSKRTGASGTFHTVTFQRHFIWQITIASL